MRPLRQVIDKYTNQNSEDGHQNTFPLEAIIEEFRGKLKSLIFTDDDIQALFDYKYGSAYTFSTLALLYPTLDFKNKFHVDHIFPKSLFKRANLEKVGVSEDKINIFIEGFDFLANLQLLEGIPNIEKSNKDFKEWRHFTYPDFQARQNFMERNYIPDVDLSFENFDVFINERTGLMKQKFLQLLKY